jgi:hypothetical protein
MMGYAGGRDRQAARRGQAVAREIEFPPVENGLDYLQSAVTHLRDEPTPRDLKYAVLHLHSAVEVLLKVRLIREDWSLIFTDPSKATHAAFLAGDFGSIGIKGTITRLKEKAGVELTDEAQKSFKRLTDVRNKLQHFGLKEQALAVEALAGEVLDALLVFIGHHLEPGAKPDEEEPLREARELIRKEISRISALVDARTRRITPELDEKTDYIVTCPDCLHLTLELGEESEPGRCLFCDRAWHDPEEMAGDYAWSVLHRSWYEAVTDGDKAPVRTCPACDFESLVDDVIVRADEDIPRWVCFNCMAIVPPDGIDECLRCGALMLVGEDSSTVCDDCWRDAIERD